MGGTGVALGEGLLEELLVNPASLAYGDRRQVWTSYSALLDRARLSQLGYGHSSLFYGNSAAQLHYLNYGSIQGYDALDNKTGTVGASDRLVMLSWGRAMGRGLSLGSNFKWAHEKLDTVSADALAFDLGASYELARLRGISLGLVLRHAGPGARFERKTEELPFQAAWGVGYTGLAHRLKLALDFERSLDRAELLQVHIGAEYWMHDILALRAGYKTDSDVGPGLSAGLGFKLSRELRLDYSFSPFSSLGNIHRVSLVFRFGESAAESLYQQGLHQLHQGLYADAILLFDKALAAKPDHRKALQGLKEAGEKLKAELKDRNQ